jgi:hypothetical protein
MKTCVVVPARAAEPAPTRKTASEFEEKGAALTDEVRRVVAAKNAAAEAEMEVRLTMIRFGITLQRRRGKERVKKRERERMESIYIRLCVMCVCVGNEEREIKNNYVVFASERVRE